MYILDPERDGCTVWRISPNSEENYVTYLAGTCEQIVNTLLRYVTVNDMVYIDISPATCYYKDLFTRYGLSLNVVPGRRIEDSSYHPYTDWWRPIWT